MSIRNTDISNALNQMNQQLPDNNTHRITPEILRAALAVLGAVMDTHETNERNLAQYVGDLQAGLQAVFPADKAQLDKAVLALLSGRLDRMESYSEQAYKLGHDAGANARANAQTLAQHISSAPTLDTIAKALEAKGFRPVPTSGIGITTVDWGSANDVGLGSSPIIDVKSIVWSLERQDPTKVTALAVPDKTERQRAVLKVPVEYAPLVAGVYVDGAHQVWTRLKETPDPGDTYMVFISPKRYSNAINLKVQIYWSLNPATGAPTGVTITDNETGKIWAHVHNLALEGFDFADGTPDTGPLTLTPKPQAGGGGGVPAPTGKSITTERLELHNARMELPTPPGDESYRFTIPPTVVNLPIGDMTPDSDTANFHVINDAAYVNESDRTFTPDNDGIATLVYETILYRGEDAVGKAPVEIWIAEKQLDNTFKEVPNTRRIFYAPAQAGTPLPIVHACQCMLRAGKHYKMQAQCGTIDSTPSTRAGAYIKTYNTEHVKDRPLLMSLDIMQFTVRHYTIMVPTTYIHSGTAGDDHTAFDPLYFDTVTDAATGKSHISLTPLAVHAPRASFLAYFSSSEAILGPITQGVISPVPVVHRLWLSDVVIQADPTVVQPIMYDEAAQQSKYYQVNNLAPDPAATPKHFLMGFFLPPIGTLNKDEIYEMALCDPITNKPLVDESGKKLEVKLKAGDSSSGRTIAGIVKNTGLVKAALTITTNVPGAVELGDRYNDGPALIIVEVADGHETDLAFTQYTDDRSGNYIQVSHTTYATMFDSRTYLHGIVSAPVLPLKEGTNTAGEDVGAPDFVVDAVQGNINLQVTNGKLNITDDGNLAFYNARYMLSEKDTEVLRGKQLVVELTSDVRRTAETIHVYAWTKSSKPVYPIVRPAPNDQITATDGWVEVGKQFVAEDNKDASLAVTIPANAERIATVFHPIAPVSPLDIELVDFSIDIKPYYNAFTVTIS